MPVNANKSGTRLLQVLEQIARSQPVGVRQLARMLDLEKSATQRAVTTLAEAGWIQPASLSAAGWELSVRILHVSHLAHGSNSLRQRARPALEALRDATNETAYLAIPAEDGFVVLDVAESRESLRTVVPCGSLLHIDDMAIIDAVLPYLGPEKRDELMGKVPKDKLRRAWQGAMETGYSIAEDAQDENSITIAVPVLGTYSEAIGALCVRAVRARTGPEKQREIGRLLLEKQQELSLGSRHELRAADLRRAIGGFG